MPELKRYFRNRHRKIRNRQARQDFRHYWLATVWSAAPTFEPDGCNPHEQSSLTALTVADQDAFATVSPSEPHKQSVLTVRTVESGRRAGGEVVPTAKASVAAEVMTRVQAAGGWLFLRGDGLVRCSFPDCITDADLDYLHGLLD